MNRTELIREVRDAAELSTAQAEAAIDALVNTLTHVLKDGDKITLKGFGTFEVRERGERTGRNPQTGETMTIAASKVPAFKASSTLKKLINEK